MSGNRVKIIGLNIAVFAGLALFSQAGAVTPMAEHKVILGETQYFKNWAAGCDNTLSCQALAMQPEENGEGYLTLSMTRGAGKAGGPTIEITGMDADVSKYQIFVDRRLVSSGVLKGPNDSIALSVRDSARLVKAIPKGNEIRVTDGAGTVIGRISLSGSAAAIGYLDSVQNRSRARAQPIITASRIGKEDLIPETGDLVALAEGSKCAADRQGVTEDSAYSLGKEGGKARALALISCGNGAYNFSSVAYIGTRGSEGKWKFEPARFDYAADKPASQNGQKLITNAEWNPEKQTLNSYNKGRAFADCGSTDDFAWDGRQFRLIRAERMQKCQGSPVWITVWRAGIKFVG